MRIWLYHQLQTHGMTQAATQSGPCRSLGTRCVGSRRGDPTMPSGQNSERGRHRGAGRGAARGYIQQYRSTFNRYGNL